MATNQINTYPIEIQIQIAKLKFKMLQLGFEASFEKMEEGPVLRTFFFEPDLKSLFSKIINKEEEIAGALAVESVRIERDRGHVAIAVPREDRQIIRFDQCIHRMLSGEPTKNMLLPLLMGQSPNGEYLYADLAEQPHLLIAGATGSGKSVFTSQIICSLALFRSPQELQFVLVDTKNLDLVLFQTLSHVKDLITDVDVLRHTLEFYVDEVRRRTTLMSGLARNIREYNAMGMGRPLSHIVIIIDELADVLDTDVQILSKYERDERPDSVASLLKRLCQISRAAGIHVVCATQRPSAAMQTGDSKVKFGDIKANLPARISFKLPTMTDSRVVLDENGAENLLGKGDYLYKIAGTDSVGRAHSAYVQMEDIAMIMNQHEQIRRSYAHA